MSRILRLLNIKPEEQRAVVILAIYYFLQTAVYIIGLSATSSLFLNRVKPDDLANASLPLLMTVNEIMAAPLVALFNRLSERMPLNVLVIVSNLFFASLFVIFEVVLQLASVYPILVWVTALMFVTSVLSFTLGQMQFYLIASTIFDARQSKRILGVIGIGGALAGILSGLALRPLIEVMKAAIGDDLATESLVVLVAILIVVTTFVIRQTRPFMRFVDEPSKSDDPKTQTDRVPVYRDPYLLMLMVIVGAFILVATTVDIQWRITAKEHFDLVSATAEEAEAALTAFNGTYSAGAGVAQLVMRLFVVSPILVNFGILAGLILLPITIAATSSVYLAFGGLATSTLVKGGDQMVRFTLNETATELAWVPVPTEQRLQAKPFISGTFIAIVQGVTGVLLFTLNRVGIEDVSVLSYFIIGVCVLWIPATIALSRGYVRKLMDSIKNRDFQFEDLEINTADNAIVRTVEETLRNGTDLERAFVLDIIDDVNITPFTGALAYAFDHTESVPVRERILTLTAGIPQCISNERLLELIRHSNELTDEALVAAGERNLLEVMPLLLERMKDNNMEVRAAAALAVLRIKRKHVREGIDTLQNMLKSSNADAHIWALDTILRLPVDEARAIVSDQQLRWLLGVPAPQVQLRAMQVIAHVQAPMLDELVEKLGSDTTEAQAQTSLEAYPPDEVSKLLLRYYTDSGSSTMLRQGINRALNDYLNGEVVAVMLDALESENRALFNGAVETLLIAARTGLIPKEGLQRLEGHGLRLAYSMYELYVAEQILSGEPHEILFHEMVDTAIKEATPTLLKLSIMDAPETDIESVIYRLEERNPQIIGNVLEILDNVLSQNERAAIIPLFEDHEIGEFVEIGRKQFPDLNETLEDELIYYINYGDDWQSAVALDYIMRHPQLNIHIGRAGKNISAESRELIAKHGTAGAAQTLIHKPEGQEEMTYSILEKTVLLKNSALFEGINARELYHIAQIAESVSLNEGEALFHEGMLGDAMYIIARGSVRIHQGDTTIVELGEGAAIGEIALLDQQPRTASATALTAVNLLKINATDFFETVTIHKAINQSIMRLLAGRVRNLLRGVQSSTGSMAGD